MKNLCVLALSLLLLMGCSNEEVLPYEVPLEACKLGQIPPTVVIGNLSNEIATVKGNSRSFSLVVEGSLFTQNKEYVVCNLPQNLQKNGQRIKFNANSYRDTDPRKASGILLELTDIKLVK